MIAPGKIATFTRVYAAALLALGAAACTNIDATAPADVAPQFSVEPPELGKFTVCKIGTAATFDDEVGAQPGQFSLPAGGCETIATNSTTDKETVTVSELLNSSLVLDSIIVQSFVVTPNTPPTVTKLTGTNTFSAIIDGDHGIIITFFNHPFEAGNEGCTLGFWKQDQHFDSWVGFSPGDLISSVFNTSGFPTLGSKTLLQGLNFKGGPTVTDAAALLLKQGIAALLNSTAVNFQLSTQQVISQVNAALASNNRQTILNLQNQLDTFNNAGCPLN